MKTPMKSASADRTVVIDGVAYTLRFSFQAQLALQEYWGLASLDQLPGKFANLKSLQGDDLVAIFWAGLRRHHPEVSKEKVVTLLDDLGLDNIALELGFAYAGAMPMPDETTEGAGSAAARPTHHGTSTGSSKKRRQRG